jgi:hypothetical protein
MMNCATFIPAPILHSFGGKSQKSEQRIQRTSIEPTNSAIRLLRRMLLHRETSGRWRF